MDSSEQQQNSDEKQKIVCIGDSITQGEWATSPAMSYPGILQSVLGHEKYEVQNLGIKGATMMNETDSAISKDLMFKNFLTSKVDVVLLMLGTMDAKEHWDEDAYKDDYYKMIMQIQQMESKPRLFIMVPPPVYNENNNLQVDQEIINDDMPYQIPDILTSMSIDESMLINCFEKMGGSELSYPNLFASDGVHPNDEGNLVIAELAAKAMKLPFEVPQFKRDWIKHIGHADGAYFLQAIGNQEGWILSHCNGHLSMVGSVGGEGELWKLQVVEFPFQEGASVNLKFYLQCMGAEQHLWLSHANAQMALQPAAFEGEELVVDTTHGANFPDKNEIGVVINLTGGEANSVFGHYDGQLLCLPKFAADVETTRWKLKRA